MDRRSFLGKTLRRSEASVFWEPVAHSWLVCTSGASPATVASSIRPRYGGRLNVGIVAETTGLDPTVSPFTTAAIYYARPVFDPLTAVAGDGSIHPYLAQSITPNPDFTVWTIRLRPDVLCRPVVQRGEAMSIRRVAGFDWFRDRTSSR
jgi:hypothetical protein